MTSQQIASALDRTRAGFALWSVTPLSKRTRVLAQVGRLLLRDQDRLARLAALEMGKPITQARAEVRKCAALCRYVAAKARSALAVEQIKTGARASYVRFDPLGVVLAIMPWNYPYWQVVRAAVPALAAGNAVALKAASNVPRCARALELLMHKAGVPAGVFVNFPLEAARATKLIADPRIAAVTLTGSDVTGSLVGAAAGRALKPAVMELGGSDAFIVLADADLAVAARLATEGRLTNAGQSCTSAKRIIVVGSVAGEFEQRLVAAVKRYRVGNPLTPATQMGPLARPDVLRRVEAQVRASIQAGAKLLLGGRRLAGKKYGDGSTYYAPTILSRVGPGMRVFEEEVFGPVLCISRVPNPQAAVQLANRSPFGLGASIWTRNRARAERMAAALHVGTVVINGRVRSDPRLPFGGVKRSGYGRELGTYGIRSFVNVKTVVVGPRWAP